MRLVVTLILALFVLDATALAQQKPIVPLTAVSSHGQLSGRKKVVYVCRQLDLTEEQRQQARGLIEALIESADGQDIPLERIYRIVQELQEAEAAGDKETQERLSQELRSYGERRDASTEVFMNLEKILTEAQKAKMEEALGRLKRNPSGALRPVDVFRELDQLRLDSEQSQKVARLRKQLTQATRGMQSIKDSDRFQLLNGILSELINGVLSAEQRAQFERALSRLRPDLAYRMRVMTPAEEEEFIEQHAQPKAGGADRGAVEED